MKSNHWTPQKCSYLKGYIPLSEASSNNSRLRSWLLLERGTGALPARGTERRVTIALRRPNWLRVSASVGMSSQPQEIKAASLMPMKYQIYATVPNIAKILWNFVTTLDAQAVGGLLTRLGTSSQEVAHPNSIPLPEPHRTTAKASPGWTEGSPEELNTKRK